MSDIHKILGLALVAVALAMASADAQAPKKQLVVALNQDPDILDPTLSRTYVGTDHLLQMCEKLYEIDESLNILRSSPPRSRRSATAARPSRSSSEPGVKFNDGTPINAEAMKLSLDRHRT